MYVDGFVVIGVNIPSKDDLDGDSPCSCVGQGRQLRSTSFPHPTGALMGHGLGLLLRKQVVHLFVSAKSPHEEQSRNCDDLFAVITAVKCMGCHSTHLLQHCRFLMQGKYLADTSMSEIVDLIHLTAKEASERLGMGTSLKRCGFKCTYTMYHIHHMGRRKMVDNNVLFVCLY